MAGQEPGAETTALEEALDHVLHRYGLPLDGYQTGGDRGDLASDLASAVRRLPTSSIRPRLSDVEHQTFPRWKYAEEEAKRLIDAGRLVTLSILPDVEHEEDGEVYVYDEFVVEDLGERHG